MVCLHRWVLLIILAAWLAPFAHALPPKDIPGKPFPISVEQPAYAGEPIWVQIAMPPKGKLTPAEQLDFPPMEAVRSGRCDRLELRYEGKPVPRRPLDKTVVRVLNSSGYSIPYDPSKIGCLPNRITNPPGNRISLQAQYAVTRPGVYSVRVISAWPGSIGVRTMAFIAHSSWFRFEVLPRSAAQRAAWLTQLIGHRPADVASLRDDYLPSLVAAAPDPRALRAVVREAFSSNRSVAMEALRALAYFPNVGARKLYRDAILRQGPTELLAGVDIYDLNSSMTFRVQIVHTSLRNLTSGDPEKEAGAILTLFYERYLPTMKPRLDPALLALADQKVLKAAPAIIAAKHEDAMRTLSRYLGASGEPRAHRLLWEIADAGGPAQDQALEAIMYHPEPSDLPKMEAVLLQPGGGQFVPSEFLKLFLKDFGDRAVPVLQKLMRESPYLWVRITSAQQLLPRNDPGALRFFIGAIGLHRWPYSSVPRWEWIQLVQQAYPGELPANANQEQVLALLRARLFAAER